MRASTKKLGLALCAGIVLGAGCDWRKFDDLKKKVPVQLIDPPSDFSSESDFGSLLLPLTPPADGSAAAWFLASATETTGLALIKLDPSGGASAASVKSPALDDLEGSTPLTAMAEIPGTGTVLLGAPTISVLLTMDLATGDVEPFVPASVVTASEPMLGVGVAAGALGGTATPDVAVASNESLHVFLDGAAADLTPSAADLTSCPITLAASLPNRERLTRAMAIGPLLSGGAAAVAVGTPGASAPGTVSLFTVSGDALACAGQLSGPALASGAINVGFGASLALGDFDGDGVTDLLVGAPPAGVYLYKGPLTLPASAPAGVVPPLAGSAQFGAAVAALNLDGLSGDEAMVGDPGAIIDAQSGAGNVSFYSGPALETQVSPTPFLDDRSFSADAAYGSAVAALPFCATPPCATPPKLPLVGAPSNAFVYFTLGGADPRTP